MTDQPDLAATELRRLLIMDRAKAKVQVESCELQLKCLDVLEAEIARLRAELEKAGNK